MYQKLTEFFKEVSERSKLLGRTQGKINTLFIETPEIAEMFLASVKNSVTYPLLMVEYFDEEITYHGSGYSRDITVAFAVLSMRENKVRGVDNARIVIYEKCKPAAEAVLSLLRDRVESGTLNHNGYLISLADTIQGNWIGPLHNDLYGWRIELSLRVPGAPCYRADDWLPVIEEEDENEEP